MNEHLRFTWGHIIAFLALIFISFVTFDGVVYFTDGDFKVAAIALAVVDILLFVFFIGAQALKATDHHFATRIWFERLLIFLSPFAFVALMLPFFHFWTVYDRGSDIEKSFTSAISSSKSMFSDYEEYSEQRIQNYEMTLDQIIANRNKSRSDSKTFANAGFSSASDDCKYQKNNMLKALRLQLLSQNYYNLSSAANAWIDGTKGGVSTFNVFMLGNIREIKSAIEGWHKQLEATSSKTLSNEQLLDNTVVNFANYNKKSGNKDQTSSVLQGVYAKLDGLTGKFTKTAAPSTFSIILAVVLYLALLFPYFLQTRHTKAIAAHVGLLHGAKNKGGGDGFDPFDVPEMGSKKSNGVHSSKATSSDGAFEMQDSRRSNDMSDDMGAFTM